MINNKSSNSDYLLTELERTKIETINFTSATGSVVIPSGLPIGTKKLVRKINATQGTVTISCTGETFTPSLLSSLTLNANGDFWLLEKVTSTRWDLIDGVESGGNANGRYKKNANGTVDLSTAEKTYSAGELSSFTLPCAVIPNSFLGSGIYGVPYSSFDYLYGFGAPYMNTGTTVTLKITVGGGSNMYAVVLKMRWY